MGFPGDSVGENLPAVRRGGSIPESGRYPGEEKGNLFQYFNLGDPTDRGARQAPGVTKELDTIHWLNNNNFDLNWPKNENIYIYIYTHTYIYKIDFPVAQVVKNMPVKKETRVRFLGWEISLEEGMAIHSSTLAWRIPWTEKPGRLQSMRSQRVGHDWVTNTHIWYIKYFIEV